MSNKTKIWLKAAIIRAVKTFSQALIGFVSSEAIALHMVDWKMGLSVAALSGLLSILTSVAGLPEVDLLENEED